MNIDDKPLQALGLQQAERVLEQQIQEAVRAYEHRNGGPIELDMDFMEGGNLGAEALQQQVRFIVSAFLEEPVVRRAGLRVHKVTAIDSDADEHVVVRVTYDYLDED